MGFEVEGAAVTGGLAASDEAVVECKSQVVFVKVLEDLDFTVDARVEIDLLITFHDLLANIQYLVHMLQCVLVQLHLGIIVPDHPSQYTGRGGEIVRLRTRNTIHRTDLLNMRDAFIEHVSSCAICTNDVPRASIPSTITGKCSHPNRTCRACIASWIASRLDSSGHDSLTCPECNELLSEIDIKAFTTPEVYGRYEDQVLRSALSKDPEFHWCVAPGCHSGHLHAGSSPIFRCIQCGTRSCIKHNVLWHEGMTCTEYDSSARSSQRAREEAASIEKVKEMSKPCPGRGCGWRIEKKGGCDHMTCHKCRTEFCWRCSADYNDIRRYGNEAHKPTCHYHPTNL